MTKTPPTIAASKSDDLFRRPTYRTGDGEIVVVPRPGSLDALGLPSKFASELRYRDGRVEKA